MLVLAAWPCSGRGCIEPSLGAWVLVLFALPTALMAGVPWFCFADSWTPATAWDWPSMDRKGLSVPFAKVFCIWPG